MAGEEDGRMSDKELVQTRWRGHKEAFRAGAFEPDGGGVGFLAVDRADLPPSFHLVTVTESGFRARRGDLLTDRQAQMRLPTLAKRILDDEFTSVEVPMDEAFRFYGLAGEGHGGLAELSVSRFARNLGAPRLAARLPRDGLIASEARRFGEAGLGAIRSRFHPDALTALGAAEGFLWRDLAFYSAEGATGDIRRQAARHFPLFAAFIVSRFSVRRGIDAQVAEKTRAEDFLRSPEYRAKLDTPQERGGVTRTTEEWMRADGRDPFAPWQLAEKAVRQALQASFGAGGDGQPRIPMHVLNNLRGVSWPTSGVPIERLVEALAELPPDWFPKTKNDWDAFCDLTDAVTPILSRLGGKSDEDGRVVPVPLRTLYEGCGGKWADLRDRFVRAYADQRPPEGATEADVTLLETGIDWGQLQGLPQDKLEAGAQEAVARLDGLSAGCSPTEISSWIRRRVAPDTSREALRNASFEVEEMLDGFSRKVLVPLAANEATRRSGRDEHPLAEQHHVTSRAAAARILVPGKSAVRLMETVRAFINRAAEILGAGEDEETDAQRAARELEEQRMERHQAMNAVGVDPNKPIPEDGWAPLCPIVRAPNGVYIVPLTEPEMLRDEGRARSGPSLNRDGSNGLRICVGEAGQGYIGRCQREGQHIVSFRVTGGRDGVPYTRLSCLQLGPIRPGSPELQVLQHRGFQNGAVPEPASRALDWFQGELRAGNIKLNEEGIRERISLARAGKADEVALTCGYDWRSRKRIYQAMAPWGMFVGKKHRRMGIDEFAADADVMSVVQAIDPEPDYSAPMMFAPSMGR